MARPPTHCPACYSDLRYKADGRRLSSALAVIANDRIVAWRCPHCEAEWRAADG